VYRVRGAGSNTSEDTGWIAPPTQEEEEEEIRKSLARAKKKMKKNLQIQEWLKNKEDKINEKVQQEVSHMRGGYLSSCVVTVCVGGREESNGGSR
jgi:Ser-tRNA(Ala) deacylase AlaX